MVSGGSYRLAVVVTVLVLAAPAGRGMIAHRL